MAAADTETQEESRVSVFFLDVRNFTLLLDNYDAQDVTNLLNYLFDDARDVIEEFGGNVDKIIGDGLMAVFEGESSGHRAAEAAVKICQETVANADETEKFSTIDIGIGIATGTVLRANFAEIDSTVVGRCVNIASRLQGICKKYHASILIDEQTYDDVLFHELPSNYTSRMIPNQDLRGIRRGVNVYQICNQNRLSEEYITLFNQGVEEFISQNYEKALNAFTQAYTRDERYTDQALLTHFTNSCLQKIDDNRALFRNPDRYEEHSTTQEQQSIELEGYIRQVTLDWGFDPEQILDIGCGTGKVTERLAKSFPDASVVGIDSSRSAIGKARTEHTPEEYDIEYKHAGIESYCPKEERGHYDLLFSNAAMHWVSEQHKAYENMRALIDEDGLLAIHQGHKGTYKELHEVAVELLNSFGYDQYFEDLTPPLDLIYYTEEGIKDLLRRHGFEPYKAKVDEGTAPDTIIEDFAEASLNAYCDRLENESQREVFREQFKQQAHGCLDPEDITVRRIYITATPSET